MQHEILAKMNIEIRYGNIISLNQLRINREDLDYKRKEDIATKPLPYFKVNGDKVK